MYKHFEKTDVQRLLRVGENYDVDALLVVGTHPKTKEYLLFFEALEKFGIPFEEEKLDSPFFSEIKSILIGGKRLWFDVVYGTTYLCEVVHVAAMLGSKNNILLGTCGSLREDLNSGDLILPFASYGNESSTRMYQKDNKTYLYESDKNLCMRLKERIGSDRSINEGKLMTVQAMLAESKEDIDNWSKEGYCGVDMESATLFAVSNHFGIPSAALLCVADSLVKNELVGSVSCDALRTLRTEVRKENYAIALKTLLG